MASNEVSDTISGLLDGGKIIWPKSPTERSKFISDNFGMVWNALLSINIHANLEVFSHVDDDSSFCGTCENASGTAWDALCRVLFLVLVLEDALGTDITFSSEYGKPDELSGEKAKVRSLLRSRFP